MRAIQTILVLTLLAICSPGVNANPPKVIQSIPENNARDVDPASKEIRVVFDQDMLPAGQSIVGGGATFPIIRGRASWPDARTISIPVTLLPNRNYELSINSDRFTNFKNIVGESAIPYPITFRTGSPRPIAIPISEHTPPTPPPAPRPIVTSAPAPTPKPVVTSAPAPQPATVPASQAIVTNPHPRAVQQLKDAIDRDYANHDLRKVDWDKLFSQYRPRLENAQSPKAFAAEAAKMLAAAQDVHLWLRAQSQAFPTIPAVAPDNYNFTTLTKIVPNWREHNGIVYTGRFPDGVGYVNIITCDADRLRSLLPILEVVREPQTKSLIIDVRMNFSGDESVAQKVAAWFVTAPKPYRKDLERKAGQWLAPVEKVLDPNPARFAGKIAVLTGPQCMSTNEAFLLMMQAGGATLIGEKTFGAAGNPRSVQLDNGVMVFIPDRQMLLLDGTSIEGRGISPQIQVKTEPKDFQTTDPVLEAALKFVRGK